MTKVKLSKRLKAIADLVNPKSSILDIGCDHALLDIYLLQNKIIKKSLACDITEGALKQARTNIVLYDVKNIETRLSDGFGAITKNDKVDTVIISGLGGKKIMDIVFAAKEKLSTINTIIIQSNTDVENVREGLVSLGYKITNEKLVKERNIIYTIIKFEKGIEKYNKKEILYGPILLKNKDKLFNELLDNKISKNNYIINKLPKKQIFRKMLLKISNAKIKKERLKERDC